MAVRDDRSDVKQTTAGFRGPLMVQSLTSAKSKFLSLKEGDSFFLPNKIFPWKWMGPDAYLCKNISKVADTYLGNILYTDYQKINILNGFNKRKIQLEFLKILNRIIFGVSADTYIQSWEKFSIKTSKYWLGFSNKYISKNNIKPYDIGIDLKELRSIVIRKQKRYVTEVYDNMVLDEFNDHAKKRITYQHLVEFYNMLFEVVKNFAIKAHPNTILDKNKQINQPEILFNKNYKYFPVHFPSEFLLHNIRKNIIGITSATLVTAAKQEHLKAISLLDMIEWKCEKNKKHYKDFLINQDDRILFPKDLDQFRELIYS